MMARNGNLAKAKKAKNDEFYTQYEDIEKEIMHYDLRGMSIYSSCDDYRWSNFKRYFVDHFDDLGIKKYCCTNYDIGDGAWAYEYDGKVERITRLEGNGDFRSEECVAFLKEADIVVTNPPFSLFREYVAQLMEYEKKFIIIGNGNAIGWKEVFPYIKNNQLWLGMNWVKNFIQPDKTIKSFGNICWYTNIPHNKRNKPLDLYKKYNPTDYPKYDNYDVIEVSKTAEIPMDYDGVMGVPITFLDKYCPEQFELLDINNRYSVLDHFGKNEEIRINHSHGCNINGKSTYSRIFIKRK